MNFVLETTNTSIDILDIDFLGDFTIELSAQLNESSAQPSGASLLSGPSFSVAVVAGEIQVIANGSVIASTDDIGDPGDWVNLSIVRDAGTIRLYTEGELADTAGSAFTGNFTISDIANGFDGRIDGVRLWSTARDELEIELGAAGFVDIFSGLPIGLERYYRFDDDEEHIVDATGNAEQGHDLHLPTGAGIVEDLTAPATNNQGAIGFIDTKVADGLFLATAMEFLPDGRMIVSQQNGVITIIEDPAQIGSATSTYLDLSGATLAQVESGMLSLAVDPEFATNGYVYAFYTNAATNKSTVSRFTHQENGGGTSSQLDPSSEVVMWRETDTFSDGHHQGGAIEIAYEPVDASDPSPYKLYITVGEEFEGANSQDLTHDDGKVHRVNLTDGSIPTDNPYYDAAVAAQYTPSIDTSSAISTNASNLQIDPEGVMTTIYSYGLRNPFRSSYDQETETLWIGDVGGNNGFSWEDVHVTGPGFNHGWPEEEGYHDDPNDLGSAVFSYQHLTAPGVNDTGRFGSTGSSITGGVIYRGEDFPEEYQGAYFYGDWVRKWIRVAEVDFSGDFPVVTQDSHFAYTGGQVLDFIEGPDGALYYLTTFDTGNTASFTGSVHRLTFDADNRAPQGLGIVLDPGEESSTVIPHTVTFEADAIDPDGDEITYQWDFGDGIDLDGDGNGDTATSTEQNPAWTYTAAGEYTVELIVTDSNGAANVFDPVIITVGNAPTVNITSPIDEMTFRAGDTITLTGTASDLEDGDLTLTSSWSVQFLHNEHSHPQLPATPNVSGGLTIDIPINGHDYFDNTGFAVFLTATDSDGLTTTDQVIIRPEEATVTYDLPEADGFALQLDGVFYFNDIAYDNVIGFNHTLEVPEEYLSNGATFEFSHWSDDPSITTALRSFVVPENDLTIAPVYDVIVNSGLAVSLDGATALPGPDVTLGAGGSDFTIEGWIQFAEGESVAKTDSLFYAVDDNGEAIDLNFHGGVGRLYSRAERSDLVSTTTQVQAGEWHHYALTREAGELSIYVNGVLEGTSTSPFLDSFTVERLGGSFGGGVNLNLDGALDEVRLWDVARSATEIAEGYLDPAEGGELGLSNRYAFDGDGLDSVGTADIDIVGFGMVGGAPMNVPDNGGGGLPERGQAIELIATDGGLAPVSDLVVGTGGTNFTIEGWMQFAEGASVGRNDGLFYAEDGSGQAFDLNFFGGVGRAYSRGERTDFAVSTTQVQAGEWYHVALTRDAGILSIYIDGILEGTATETFADALDIQRLGGSFAGGSLDLEGALDEYRIWNVARSATEIADNQLLAVDPSSGGLAHVYSFDGDGVDSVGGIDVDVVDRTFVDGPADLSANDPDNVEPVANDDSYTLLQGFDPVTSHLHILDNDSDIDGTLNPQMVEIVSGPTSGSIEIIDTEQELTDRGLVAGHFGHAEFTPTDPNFFGTDSFTYRVQDDDGAWSNVATVSLTVEEVLPNVLPVAVDDSFTLLQGFDPSTSQLHILNNDSDVDGTLNPLMVEIVSGPTLGSIEILDTAQELADRGLTDDYYGHAEFTPTDPAFIGNDSFTYRVQDDEGDWSNVATVSLTVEESILAGGGQAVALDGGSGLMPLSDLEIGSAGSDFTVEGWIQFADGASVGRNDGLFYAEDESGQGFDVNFFRGVGRAYSRGERTDFVEASTVVQAGEWHHVALTRDAGILSIYIDGVLENTAVEAFNDALDIQRLGGSFAGGAIDLEGALDEVRIWDVARSATEIADNQLLSVDLSSAGLTHLYAFDGDGTDSVGTVDIDVTGRTYVDGPIGESTIDPVNQAPTATDDSYTFVQGFDPVASHLHILTNDGDPDGTLNPQIVEIVSGPNFGSVEVIDTAQELADRGLMAGHYGHVEFMPSDPDFVGTDSFTYRVQDDDGAWSNVATATITVDALPPENVAPVAVDDSYTLTQGFDPVASHLHILMNDSDSDGTLNPQMVEIVSGPSFGSVEVIDTAQELADRGLMAGHYGHVEFMPTDPDFFGTDSFTYRVQDDDGEWSNFATVSITVEEDVTVDPGPGGDSLAVALDGGVGITLVNDLVVGTAGSDFTIEGWMNFAAGSSVGRNDGLFYAKDEVGKGFDLNFFGGVGRAFSRGERADLVTSTSQVQDGEWHHVALTREAGFFSIYLDGVLEGTATDAFTDALDIQRLGGSYAGSTTDLEGALDEFRVWDVARSATEIADFFDLSITDPATGLQNNYHFDGTGDDSAGGIDTVVAGLTYVDGFDFV